MIFPSLRPKRLPYYQLIPISIVLNPVTMPNRKRLPCGLAGLSSLTKSPYPDRPLRLKYKSHNKLVSKSFQKRSLTKYVACFCGALHFPHKNCTFIITGRQILAWGWPSHNINGSLVSCKISSNLKMYRSRFGLGQMPNLKISEQIEKCWCSRMLVKLTRTWESVPPVASR